MAEGADLAGWLVSKVACRDTVAAAFERWHLFLERTLSPTGLVMAVPGHTQASAPGGCQRCVPGLQGHLRPAASLSLFRSQAVGLGFHLDEEVAGYRHSNSMAGLKQGAAVPGLREVVLPRAG